MSVVPATAGDTERPAFGLKGTPERASLSDSAALDQFTNLSSENIMISQDNHIKLADFALTKPTNNEVQNQSYNNKIRG
ncbi:MAG: hypothetical protein IJ589_08430, partial [Lachnospiraceae bacterium]|nr:hypothetical protein [Lachnospiraceae bacterium]